MHLDVELPAASFDECRLNHPLSGKKLGHGERGEASSGAPGQDSFHRGRQLQRERSEAGRTWERDRPPSSLRPRDISAQSSLETLWVGGKLWLKSQETHLLTKGSFPTKTKRQGHRCLGKTVPRSALPRPWPSISLCTLPPLPKRKLGMLLSFQVQDRQPPG